MNLFDLLFSYRGRIGRLAFWVATVAVSIVMTGFSAVLSAAIDVMERNGLVGSLPPHLVVLVLIGIPSLWPLSAIQVKRWHDLNRSGFWFFINLVPTLGNLISLVACGLISGTEGENRYGEAPEGVFHVGA